MDYNNFQNRNSVDRSRPMGLLFGKGVGMSCISTFKPVCVGYYNANVTQFLVHLSDRLPTVLPCVSLVSLSRGPKSVILLCVRKNTELSSLLLK